MKRILSILRFFFAWLKKKKKINKKEKEKKGDVGGRNSITGAWIYLLFSDFHDRSRQRVVFCM